MFKQFESSLGNKRT